MGPGLVTDDHVVRAGFKQLRKRSARAPCAVRSSKPHLSEHMCRNAGPSELCGQLAVKTQRCRHLHTRNHGTAASERRQKGLDSAKQIAAMDVENVHGPRAIRRWERRYR